MNSYRFRLLYEVARWQFSVFITLTFSDKYLPKFESNPNRAIRLFLDRVRKRYGKSIRHWFTPEFGEEHDRIHYHGILFNVSPDGVDYDEFMKLWKYGFIWLGWCNAKTVNYIVKYVTKESTNNKKLPRIISSKGIGENYLTPENIALHKNEQGLAPYLNVSGYPIALPRFYYDKIFDDDDKISLVRQFMDEPKVWRVGSREYTDEESARSARSRLMLDDVLSGLTRKYRPDHVRRSSFDAWKYRISNLNIKTGFELWE